MSAGMYTQYRFYRKGDKGYMYEPCSFDRNEYLDISEKFEKIEIGPIDAETEMCEFNDDIEDLAVELAYTRYALAKAEMKLNKLTTSIENEKY